MFFKLMTPRGDWLEANLNGKNDRTIRTMKTKNDLPHSELTGLILGCCFEVMKELGPGFQERANKAKAPKSQLLPQQRASSLQKIEKINLKFLRYQ
jgi:hypothetical protein